MKFTVSTMTVNYEFEEGEEKLGQKEIEILVNKEFPNHCIDDHDDGTVWLSKRGRNLKEKINLLIEQAHDEGIASNDERENNPGLEWFIKDLVALLAGEEN